MIRIRMSDVLALLLVGVVLFLWLLSIYPKPTLPERVVCGTSMAGIGKYLIIWANDREDGRLPLADQWCDVLLIQDYVSTRQFVCKGSDAIEGESSYAINENVAGLNPSEVPQDTVLLFETDFGKDPNGRNEFLKNRRWYETMPDGRSETRVYRNRWNQSGGPEILTTERHGGKGCNVLFMDISERFVKIKDLPKLKWKVER